MKTALLGIAAALLLGGATAPSPKGKEAVIAALPLRACNVSVDCHLYNDCGYSGLCGEVLVRNNGTRAVRVTLAGSSEPRTISPRSATRAAYLVHTRVCTHNVVVESCTEL